MAMTPEEFSVEMLNLSGPMECRGMNKEAHDKIRAEFGDDRSRGHSCCNREGDNPESHIAADELMCKVLEDLGYGKGVEIFKETIRWYE
ncbi:MAG: hypothetical protein V3W44_05160 [Dehalococcoidales bacterium]